MSPLDLWMKRAQLRVDLERQVEKILRDVGAGLPDLEQAISKLPGDAAALRGIPAIGHGVGGAMNGTCPERELLRREELRLALKSRLGDADNPSRMG